jgi:hypothetical protein
VAAWQLLLAWPLLSLLLPPLLLLLLASTH